MIALLSMIYGSFYFLFFKKLKLFAESVRNILECIFARTRWRQANGGPDFVARPELSATDCASVDDHVATCTQAADAMDGV